MNDALLVGGGEATSDLLRIVDGLARGERTVAQAVAERLAFEQFRDHVGRAAIVTDIVDRKNVRMVERGGGTSFLREALQAVGVGGERCRKNLDGDVAVEAGVAGAVDFAHPARTQRRLNCIGTEFRARGKGHSCASLYPAHYSTGG